MKYLQWENYFSFLSNDIFNYCFEKRKTVEIKNGNKLVYVILKNIITSEKYDVIYIIILFATM